MTRGESLSACYASRPAAGCNGDWGGRDSFMAKAGLVFVMLLSGLLLAGGPGSILLAQDSSVSRPDSASLTPQQARGENLFLQRCSVCHLRRQLKFGAPPTSGPSLKG